MENSVIFPDIASPQRMSFVFFALLGCYTVLIGNYWHFRTAYLSHLQGQSIQEETTYRSAQRNIQEEQRHHLHHGRCLKSNIFCVYNFFMQLTTSRNGGWTDRWMNGWTWYTVYCLELLSFFLMYEGYHYQYGVRHETNKVWYVMINRNN
jgi:hypothetical protein